MAYYYGSGSGSGGILGRGVMALQNAGVLDIILPFILVFTIVFAVLQKTKILGEEGGKAKKNYNTILALVMGMAVVIPHVAGLYPDPSYDIVNIINQALPNISVILVAIIMMLLMIGAFGGNVDLTKSKLAGWAVLFSILATIFIFGSAANWWNIPQWAGFMLDSDTQAIIVILLVFGALIAFITSEEKPAGTPKPPSFLDDLANVMKK